MARQRAILTGGGWPANIGLSSSPMVTSNLVSETEVSCGMDAGFQIQKRCKVHKEQEVTGAVEAVVLTRSSRNLTEDFSAQVSAIHFSDIIRKQVILAFWKGPSAQCPQVLIRTYSGHSTEKDLLKNIAFRLLPDYLVDYFHFRAVCRDWRSCTPDPQDFAFCFRSLHWVMVPQNASRANSTDIRHFSHLPTGQGAVVSLPEHMTHSILADIDGFLVLIDKRTNAMRLFNPFNHYLSEDLPTILRNVNDISASSSNFIILISPSTSSPGRLTVMLSFGMVDGAAFAKPGDKCWSLLKLPFFVSGALLFKGRFYFVDTCGSIWAVEPEHKLLMCVVRQDVCTRSWDIVKLGINLLLLEWGLVDKQRYRVWGPLPRLKIFEVDLDANILIPVNSIGANAIFVDQNKQTFLVPSMHPLINGDSIYFWSNRFQSIVYHLQSKRIECTGLELGHLRREVFSFLYYGPISIDLHIFNYRKYRSKASKSAGGCLEQMGQGWVEAGFLKHYCSG